MGLTPKFSQEDIHRYLDIHRQRLERLIIDNLTMIGLNFVTRARDIQTYRNITGNLRSSIGFIVMRNGATVTENFEPAPGGTDKMTGISKGKNFANTIKSGFTGGYTLIVVAGMQYAALVEARGKDVITGSSLEAKKELRAAIREIKGKMRQR